MKKFLILLLPILTISCGEGGSGGDYNPRNPFGEGPAAVSLSNDGGIVVPGDLGSAGNYVILAKTGISNVTGSAITGNIGVSPAAASYITGFNLVGHGTYATSASVIGGGRVYAATYASPTPSKLTTAIGNVEIAYTDAAGRNPPDHIELGSGEIGALTLVPDLYKWSGNVTMLNGDLTLSGSATDVWIFQIAGNLSMPANTNIILTGGALPENVYWQVAGQVTLLTGAHFEGIILSKTAVVIGTNASVDGRIYAQSAVTLDDNIITQP